MKLESKTQDPKTKVFQACFYMRLTESLLGTDANSKDTSSEQKIAFLQFGLHQRHLDNTLQPQMKLVPICSCIFWAYLI